jgi:hypothetical protein
MTGCNKAAVRAAGQGNVRGYSVNDTTINQPSIIG